MKMRYFLRGLGVGVLLATLLLCMSYRGQNSENSIIKQAKELGMQFPEKTPDSAECLKKAAFREKRLALFCPRSGSIAGRFL